MSLGAGGEGLSPKDAWWAGARAGLGVAPDMPRAEVAERLHSISAYGDSDVERVAEAIFSHMSFGAPVAWVPGLKSLRQDTARNFARATRARAMRPVRLPEMAS